ncbi:MAG: terpene cyclase/mutase family protein [Planctomycetota bacterium]|nr:terpene cyclase/mutase family protein [Planctomycetota bacterium]
MTRTTVTMFLTALLAAGNVAFSQEAPATMDDAHRQAAQALIAGGAKYLLSKQEADGAWSLNGSGKPALTALALKAILQTPGYDLKTPAVQNGLKALLSFRQKDGGIYTPAEGMFNYHNSIVIMCLSTVVKLDPQYKPILDEAVKYNRSLVIRPGDTAPKGEKIVKGEGDEGGVNYGKKGRADLSNAAMWVEAMRQAGVASDDADIQAVAGYVTRVQNNAETNKRDLVIEGPNDGGFFYTYNESKGGDGPGSKGLRSYGSMTYSGFKSLLHAGLTKDDPRVRAAFTWIRQYWRLDCNPNLPELQSQEGLYYYYHAFARALKVWNEPVIKDTKGADHNWRQELIDALKERLSPDGSWVNAKAARWDEGNPVLATCFAVLALQETL